MTSALPSSPPDPGDPHAATLGVRDLERITGLTWPTLRGRVPPPLALGGKVLRWRLSTILAWLDDLERRAGSGAEAPPAD